MARVTYGSVITALNGSIGGITFQSNRSGNIARQRPSTYKSVSPAQNHYNLRLSAFVNKFNQLSGIQKQLWNVYGDTYTQIDKWNKEKTLSGFNWYFLLNSNLDLLNGSSLTVPNGYTTPVTPGSFYCKPYSAGIYLYWDTSQLQENAGTFIFTTGPINRLTTSFRRNLRLTKVITDTNFEWINITSDWEATHNLTYPPATNLDRFSVGVAVLFVHALTGRNTPFALAIGHYANEIPEIPFGIIGENLEIG